MFLITSVGWFFVEVTLQLISISFFIFMLQSQYVFVHDSLLDYFRIGKTQILADHLQMKLNDEYFKIDEENESKVVKEWKVHQF